MITQARLKEVLHYSSESGLFTWLDRSEMSALIRSRDAGRSITSLNVLGYVQIMVDGKNYLAHRLAFLYMTGSIPKLVDHIDGNPSNNKWDNLRAATNQQNSQNSGKSKNNTSGYTGVCWDKNNNKWLVSIMVDRKSLFLGRFSELDDAIEARKVAEIKYFGDYRRNA